METEIAPGLIDMGYFPEWENLPIWNETTSTGVDILNRYNDFQHYARLPGINGLFKAVTFRKIRSTKHGLHMSRTYNWHRDGGTRKIWMWSNEPTEIAHITSLKEEADFRQARADGLFVPGYIYEAPNELIPTLPHHMYQVDNDRFIHRSPEKFTINRKFIRAFHYYKDAD